MGGLSDGFIWRAIARWKALDEERSAVMLVPLEFVASGDQLQAVVKALPILTHFGT